MGTLMLKCLVNNDSTGTHPRFRIMKAQVWRRQSHAALKVCDGPEAARQFNYRAMNGELMMSLNCFHGILVGSSVDFPLFQYYKYFYSEGKNLKRGLVGWVQRASCNVLKKIIIRFRCR